MNSSINVYELRCPHCMADLDGMPTDKAFCCRPCQTAYLPESGHFVAQPVNWAAFSANHSTPVYLPFWKFDVNILVNRPDGEDVTAQSAVRDITAVWVAAFYENRPAYFGNPGLNLTMARRLPTQQKWPHNARLLGIVRQREEAKRYVRLYVTQILDKEKDVTGYRIDVITTSSELWAMPFEYHREDEMLIDGISGFRYQSAVVSHFQEMIPR